MSSDALDQVASFLTPASAVLDAASAAVPGIGGTILRIFAAASRLAADLATKGIDPIQHIERIHAQEPALKGVQSAWRDRLDESYP